MKRGARRKLLIEMERSYAERRDCLRELVKGNAMNSSEGSIFDLSPSEKLQLVEDLWDDLAATPEEVPVHDWQKQELERRKANLLKNRASASTWQDVLRRVRGGNGR